MILLNLAISSILVTLKLSCESRNTFITRSSMWDVGARYSFAWRRLDGLDGKFDVLLALEELLSVSFVVECADRDVWLPIFLSMCVRVCKVVRISLPQFVNQSVCR